MFTFVAMQKGVDVTLVVRAPDGGVLAERDSPNGTDGPEQITALAELTGAYRIEVRKLAQQDMSSVGAYEARLVEVRAATQEELSRHAAEKELREVEKEWDAAVTNRDAPILTRLMADDFVYLSDFGSGANENKTQRLALFAQLKKDDAKDGIERHNVVDTTVRVFGDTAVATAKTTNSTRAGRKSDFVGRFIHVWQKRGGKWQVIADHFYATDPIPAQRTAVTIDESLYSRYIGEYEFTDGEVYTVSRSPEGLAGSPKREPVPWTIQFLPESPSEFFSKDDDVQLVFVASATGEVRMLSIYHGRVSRARKLAKK